MKRFLLISGTLLLAAFGSFAQKKSQSQALLSPSFNPVMVSASSYAKGTGNGDTIYQRNYTANDTPSLYVPDQVSPYDSGFVAGHNAYGDMGFAERFDIKKPDSAVSVLGAALYLVGTSTTTSTKSIKVKVWKKGAQQNITAHTYYSPKPGQGLDSLTVPLTTLRKSSGRIDSFRVFTFATPTPYFSDSFFVGYELSSYTFNSLAGDSVALVQSRNGNRHTPTYIIKGGDTMINVQNATLFSNGAWADNVYQNTPSLRTNFYVYAIYKVRIPSAVSGLTKNGLTVFGTFPNPAANVASLKFSLAQSADVTINIMDMSGKTLQTQNIHSASVGGEHVVPLSTQALPAGNYICLVHTSNGDGMGIQMTVAH